MYAVGAGGGGGVYSHSVSQFVHMSVLPSV